MDEHAELGFAPHAMRASRCALVSTLSVWLVCAEAAGARAASASAIVKMSGFIFMFCVCLTKLKLCQFKIQGRCQLADGKLRKSFSFSRERFRKSTSQMAGAASHCGAGKYHAGNIVTSSGQQLDGVTLMDSIEAGQIFYILAGHGGTNTF